MTYALTCPVKALHEILSNVFIIPHSLDNAKRDAWVSLLRKSEAEGRPRPASPKFCSSYNAMLTQHCGGKGRQLGIKTPSLSKLFQEPGPLCSFRINYPLASRHYQHPMSQGGGTGRKAQGIRSLCHKNSPDSLTPFLWPCPGPSPPPYPSWGCQMKKYRMPT